MLICVSLYLIDNLLFCLLYNLILTLLCILVLLRRIFLFREIKKMFHLIEYEIPKLPII